MRDLVELACAAYGDGEVDYGDGNEGPHESEWLVLDAGKAESVLGLSQRWTLVKAIQRTMAWYRAQQGGSDVRTLCLSDLADFEELSARADGAAASFAPVRSPA